MNKSILELACEELTLDLNERARIFIDEYRGGKDHVSDSLMRYREDKVESINLSELKKYAKLFNIGKTYVNSKSITSLDELYKNSIWCYKNKVRFLIALELPEKFKLKIDKKFDWQA